MQFITLFVSTIAVATAGVSSLALNARQIPVPGYTSTFIAATGATQAGDYLTYRLVDSAAECASFCDSVAGCGFFNIYSDVNGKDGSLQFTCSLFTTCHGIDTATNRGGQGQPDGSVDLIENSNGYCKIV